MAEQTRRSSQSSQITDAATAEIGQTSRSGRSSQSRQTPDAIEAEIVKTRAHLATTIDELAIRARPREIARRQTESAKATFVEATHTPEGDLRVERVGAIAAAAAAVLVVLALLHRRHRRG